MKKQFFATIVSIGFVFSNAMAYYGPNEKTDKPNNSKPKGANCSPATAKLTMEFNDVKALIEQGGSMFQNRQASVAAYVSAQTSSSRYRAGQRRCVCYNGSILLDAYMLTGVFKQGPQRRV